jgi:purine-nucleoside phosphorylase
MNGTSDEFDRASRAARALSAALGGAVPDVAVVLGSGLGGFTGVLDRPREVPTSSLPDWPMPGAPGHAGTIVQGRVAGRIVLVLSGRVHLYEGHDALAVTFPIRVAGCLGAKMLGLTNAAGGVNPAFAQGVLMAIDDHLNLTGANPLVGPHDARLGRRFPDMSEVYSSRLRRLAADAAHSLGLRLEHGVYAGLRGPSYETPAEIRALRALGADAVGMSTVLEALVARQMGLEVLGLSCISNMAAGLSPGPLSEEDVLATTARVQGQFTALLQHILARV